MEDFGELSRAAVPTKTSIDQSSPAYLLAIVLRALPRLTSRIFLCLAFSFPSLES
jgi:hypothetical protein